MSPQASPTGGRYRTKIVDEKGYPTKEFINLLDGLQLKTNNTLTLDQKLSSTVAIKGKDAPLAVTTQNLEDNGNFSSLDKVNDGTTYQRPLATALTAGAVDIEKVGVIGQLPSSKMHSNTALNTTNNATVDSIDAGASATVRVYGTGGVGSSWISYKGAEQTIMNPGTISGLAYSTVFYVYWDGNAYQASTTAFGSLLDGYTFAGVVTTISSGASGTATASAILAATGVASVAITNSGGGYGTPPTVSFSGGGGSGAAGTAVLTGLLVTSVTMTDPGSGYTSPPTVGFSGGGGAGAAGDAVLVPTSVALITVNTGGSGYASPPTVAITGGGGSGATATSLVDGGSVTSVPLGSGGSGYTSAPSVGFTGGKAGVVGGGTATGAGPEFRGGGRLQL